MKLTDAEQAFWDAAYIGIMTGLVSLPDAEYPRDDNNGATCGADMADRMLEERRKRMAARQEGGK